MQVIVGDNLYGFLNITKLKIKVYNNITCYCDIKKDRYLYGNLGDIFSMLGLYFKRGPTFFVP